MAESKSGVKSVIDVAEGGKGTAANDPMLVVTPEGEIVGSRVDAAPARTDGSVAQAANPVEIEVKAEVKDNRSPAEIEADLDRTRARLSATLDELSEQLTPRELARRSGQAIKARFVEPETGKMRRGPVAAAVGGLGLTVTLGTLFAVWKVRGRET